ncbi:hypothetical protein HYPSUDRAFT_199416 [Hypholoma sublateritium FD-334 SS-4]|uniref:PEBP-like protein n=1 Tax=Hypholoma sublateritium (strain FD-334 SS-4) TaxID=945553 RepID=A0A0D2Q2D3_HYPSF|nr:hypothetical protein HYPSUDRAFT_199416 [Hypholoma sublateritium FD-334 SS-4]
MRLSIFIAFASSALALAQDTSLAEVKKAFDDAHVPKDINLMFEPEVLLEVTFTQPAAKPITLRAGVQLLRNETVGPPTYNVIGASSEGPFVIAVVDPDVPTPQNTSIAQIRHFLGGNFYRMNPKAPTLLYNNTPAVSEYLQPSPRAPSDAHRYIFLLFRQSEEFNKQTLVTATTSIEHFNISSFASALKLGQPIGGTFMMVAPQV